jgi:hypothetical protein
MSWAKYEELATNIANLGMGGISKSQVSRLCGEIDERVFAEA